MLLSGMADAVIWTLLFGVLRQKKLLIRVINWKVKEKIIDMFTDGTKTMVYSS